MKTKPKKLLLLLVTMTLLASACLRDVKLNNLTFDSNKWKTGDMRTKGQMVYDLKNRKLLVGKTKQQVAEMLGACEGPDRNRWSYRVDVGIRFGGVWSYWFNVIFDEQNQTVKTTSLTD
jgi:outer membrane protein assembly factor BamE (lipoprotein component of BamABCDE complex)